MLSWLFDQSLQTYFQTNGFSQVMPMNNNKSSDSTKEPHPVRLRSLEDENSLEFMFGASKFAEVLSILAEPEGEFSISLIDQLLAKLGILSDRPSSNKKLRVLLSSFLIQAHRLKDRKERKGSQMIIGIPSTEDYWRVKSKVGYKVANKFKKALIHKKWIKLEVQASINLFDGNSNVTGYLIEDSIPELFDGLNFQSTELLYAISTSKLKTKLVDEDVEKRVRLIWEKWQQYPLVHNDMKMSSAYRRFNDTELKRGGRFYGAWTSMKQIDRLNCTIDNKPVAEVDVSGMNLTLMCSITGHIPFKSRFKDSYDCGWGNRSEVKAIINETIGSGSPRHYQRGKMTKDIGISQKLFSHIRKNHIAPKFECLQSLKKGELDSLTLAYHESEIMMRVIERSKVPIFILHDCLICQKSEALDVGKAMQMEYIAYCKEQNWKPVAPAFSIDVKAKDTHYCSGYRL